MAILIIEDEDDIRENLAELLELNGYEVARAGNGKTGFLYAVDTQPELIICDINMPGLNGYEVLQNLRENPETFAIPFLFLTAKTEISDLRKGMELGADDYITKPYENTDVLKAISVRLERSRKIKQKHADELNDIKKNFNYSLPHELRTPLNSIIGFSQILLGTKPSDFEPDELDIIYKCIFDSGKRLHGLFENVLIYNKLSVMDSSGELRNLLDKIVVNKMLINILTEKIKKKYNREDDMIINSHEVVINLNIEYFSRILEEITDNAFKFSLPGTPVEIRNYAVNGNMVLSIKNLGIGLSNDHICQIEAFRQFSREINEQQGIGIGLAIVKRIVDLIGGKFRIESVENEYALIFVTIPIEI